LDDYDLKRGGNMADVMTHEQKAAEQAVETVEKGAEELKAGEPTRAMARVQENLPSSIYLYATGASILASLILFLRKKRDVSLFVGLWAPTILNMGLFYKFLRPSRE